MRWSRENDFDSLLAELVRNPRQILVLKAIMGQESGFDPTAVGDAGMSFGLTQINEGTARGLGFTGDMRLLLDPRLQIGWALKLLQELEGQLGTDNLPEFFSAWNCGAMRGSSGWQSRCRRLNGAYSNQSYVSNVMDNWRYFSSIVGPPVPGAPGILDEIISSFGPGGEDEAGRINLTLAVVVLALAAGAVVVLRG